MPVYAKITKFREWNIKFINAMSQVDPMNEKALNSIARMADAEVMPDMEAGCPRNDLGTEETTGLDKEQLDKDLRCILMEKAVGTVHTKVMNGITKGGLYMYTDVYKRFTGTSGLGLAEQANKTDAPAACKERRRYYDAGRGMGREMRPTGNIRIPI